MINKNRHLNASTSRIKASLTEPGENLIMNDFYKRKQKKRKHLTSSVNRSLPGTHVRRLLRSTSVNSFGDVADSRASRDRKRIDHATK